MTDPIDVENWYHKVGQELTFKTTFLPLSASEAQALVDSYDDAKHGSQKTDETVLSNLVERLDSVIDPKRGAFVRLSTRSPKDVALRSASTKDIFEAEKLLLIGTQMISDVDASVIAIVRAMSKALRSANGAAAVTMLRSSERSYQDCFRRLLSTGPNEEFQMELVVREWVDILPELEFRGFVYHKKLVCLSQYYKVCYVPGLWERRDEIAARCQELHAKVQALLPHISNYVIDFALDGDKTWLVELNHWGKTASSALFDWQEDIELLEGAGFQMRVLKEPVANVQWKMAKSLRDLAWGDLGEPPADLEAPKGVRLDTSGPSTKKRVRRKKIFQRVTKGWELDGAPPSAASLEKLAQCAERRLPVPYWTLTDVSHIVPGESKFLRGENHDISTVYILLWLEMALRKTSPVRALMGEDLKARFAQLVGLVEQKVVKDLFPDKNTRDMEGENGIMGLKQLKLVRRI